MNYLGSQHYHLHSISQLLNTLILHHKHFFSIDNENNFVLMNTIYNVGVCGTGQQHY